MSEAPLLHFGGPDKPPRFLRDLLQTRVEAVPPGGRISWATYYLRDRRLAEALIAASDRGVAVRLAVEGAPRNRLVNARVLETLSAHRLNGGLHVHLGKKAPVGKKAYLHSKIYAFSHPVPSVLVGSFNPSGDDPEDPEILADIGDQDRGHNLLVEFRDAKLVRGLERRVRAVGRPLARFCPGQNFALSSGSTRMWCYPRLHNVRLERELDLLARGDRLDGAISHLKPDRLSERIAAAARRGAEVRLIVHDTERRVPQESVQEIEQAGGRVTRYEHPEGLPLHCKFLLVERGGSGRAAWFGSFNFNKRSRLYNHELLVRSAHPDIVNGLAERFEQIAAEL